MAIIPEIIGLYAEETAFLWLLRSNAISVSHYDLQDLADLDNRVEANIDGLRVAGDAGWEICREALSWEEPGEIFAAGVLAFESGDIGRIEPVLEAVGEDPVLARGLISALGWLNWAQAAPHADIFLASDASFFRYVGVAGGAVHRQCRMDALTAAASNDDLTLRARAIRAVGEMGKKEFYPIAKDHLSDDDDHCRFWATWAGAIFKDTSTLPALTMVAQTDEIYAEVACRAAVRLMHPKQGDDWLSSLQKEEKNHRIAIAGAGALGDPSLISWLMDRMAVQDLARPAGEAFALITGVDIAYADLEKDQPENFQAGPTEDPEDENVDLDPDEDLPWPDPQLVEKWWHQNKHRFQLGKRYLVGKPITEDHLQDVLRTGCQRQRAAAAIELSMLRPGRPLFEVRAPGFRQKKWLGIR